MRQSQKIAILVENNKAFEAVRNKLAPRRIHYKCNNYLFETDYRGKKLFLLETGVGKENVDQRISGMLEEHNIDFAIFLGFMGALEEYIKVGDIIIPSIFKDIFQRQEEYRSSPELLSFCQASENKYNFKLHFTNNNLTVDRVYLGDDKSSLKQANPDVSSVDMEAFGVAKRFSGGKIPFIIAKSVFDEFNFAFHEFDSLFDAEHQSSSARLLFYCLRYPQEIFNLVSLLRNIKIASRNNIRFVISFLDSMC